ncbi:hypothetical protein EV426DRAFT_436731 [Tirmania nivea]|nr:hypothetical protein EV426DRAFT_436731 [Tirmania nivea]
MFRALAFLGGGGKLVLALKHLAYGEAAHHPRFSLRDCPTAARRIYVHNQIPPVNIPRHELMMEKRKKTGEKLDSPQPPPPPARTTPGRALL